MEPSHIKIVKDICEGKDTCEIRPTSDMFGVRKQEGKVEEGENVGESRGEKEEEVQMEEMDN